MFMKYLICYLCISLLFSECSSPIMSRPPISKSICTERTLPVTPIMQVHGNLCWAACIEMVVKFIDTTSTFNQCAVLGCRNCNGCNRIESCEIAVNDASPNLIVKKLDSLGYSANLKPSRISGRLTFVDLKKEICNNRPIILRLYRPLAESRARGHYIVITGFSTRGGEFVQFIDPWASCNGCVMRTTFTNFTNGTSIGFYGEAMEAILNITKKPPVVRR